MKRLGIYLHIPFCRSKCLYCDFCSLPHPQAEQTERYVRVLCEDLTRRAEACGGYLVDTVYFGGGTPTVLPDAWLAEILETVFRHYAVSPDAEITAECNPATGDLAYFSRLRSAGFNRLSIGLQSAEERELRALGRLHGFADFCRTWEQARMAGFRNLSADVMSGIPGQSTESRLETLEKLCELEPEHISSYDLIIEEGTPFARMADRLPLPDEEEGRRMYFEGIRFLESRGWKQYEISNFAKPGYESRHNLKYWNCDEFLGFGPAAYSDFLGVRFGNSRDVAAYIDGREILAESETPSLRERANECVMLQMRLCRGVDTVEFAARFGMDFEACFGAGLQKYVPHGLVRKTARGYALTPQGMFVSNSILSEILDFSEKL
ncbi:MAG: radical SAM family heme chaperone HemW [Clostridia bacterium]|nr:radical SAM family heme chaperone HemW [Clostridia bacterium]